MMFGSQVSVEHHWEMLLYLQTVKENVEGFGIELNRVNTLRLSHPS
jgi:hypothetical protein